MALTTVAMLMLHGGTLGPALPAATAIHAADPSTGTATDSSATDAEPAPGAAAASDELERARRRYLRLYREFLGIGSGDPHPKEVVEVRGSVAHDPVHLDISSKLPETRAADRQLVRTALAARDQRYRLEFMIALVADPLDSGLASDFDLELRALLSAFADAGYQLDRHWFPWTEPKAIEDDEFRTTAGVLLFRSAADRADNPHGAGRSLVAVFLVGETPKQGIHKPAFESAVSFLLSLHRKTCLPTVGTEAAAAAAAAAAKGCRQVTQLEIPVLGPTYSGTAESLRLAIEATSVSASYRVVSGSAAPPEIERVLAQVERHQVLFSRTIVDDEHLVEGALAFFRDHMGWRLDRAALLVESDTVYGSALLNATSRTAPLLARVTKVRFPTDLFALRKAWDESAAAGHDPSGPAKTTFAPPKTALDVSLADREPPVDEVSELSPLSTRIYDITMANLGRALARERIAYIGIVATDVRDELFLAEQVRRWAPGVILFAFEGNLLYVHPQYNAVMFGTLAVSSFPLVTEGASALLSPATPDARFRRQFASELQEGVYLAAGRLLGKLSAPPSIWISASGNYALWPVAHLEPAVPRWLRAPRLTPWVWLGPSAQGAAGGAAKPPPVTPSGLQLLVLTAFLCLASRQLRRDALLPQTEPAPAQKRIRLRLSLAVAVLCTVGAALLATDLLPIWLDLVGVCTPEHDATCTWSARVPLLEWMYLLALIALHCYLLRSLLATLPLYAGRRFARCAIWASVAALTLLPALPTAVLDPVMIELFYLRARAFSSGMSPLVSLAWLGAAVVFWLYVEIQRRLLHERVAAGWPLARLEDHREPHLAGCRADARAVTMLAKDVVPASRRWLAWALPLLAIGTASLAAEIQPIAETRGYGWFLLGAGETAMLLGLLSCVRFLRMWYVLRRMLARVARTTLLPALQRVAPEVCWNPTRFSYYQLSLPAMKPSADLLQQLVDRGVATDRRQGMSLCQELEQVLIAAYDRRFGDELKHRRHLRQRFADACNELASSRAVQGVDDFYALRLTGYIHTVFVQLRYSIMGAVVTCLAVTGAAATYAFEPKSSTLLGLCLLLAAMCAAAIAVFVQMERDAALSAIAQTAADKVSFDWAFWSKVLLYGVVPVLGLAASQFPSIGRLAGGLIDVLGRVVGGG